MLALLLLLALLAPFVIYAVPGVIGADQSYVVLTGSMEPALSPGDAVVVDAVDAGAIAVGDVITFERSAANDIPTTHRVVEVVTGDAGTLCPVGDVEGMAEAGLEILSEDRWYEASDAARERATRFAARTVVQRYESYYRRTLSA